MGKSPDDNEGNDGLKTIIIPNLIAPQGELSWDQWYDLREAAFDKLKNHSPPYTHDVIEAVRHFRFRAAISWVNETGDPVDPPTISSLPVVGEREVSLKELADSSPRKKIGG
jgi:hypothetical protein